MGKVSLQTNNLTQVDCEVVILEDPFWEEQELVGCSSSVEVVQKSKLWKYTQHPYATSETCING